MAQAYSNPKMAEDPHMLPDVETFYVTQADCDYDEKANTTGQIYNGPGWYWWTCFPGCIPDSDPMGPFATEAEAVADAQDGWEEE